jgi:hypothetical protein
MRCRVIGIMVDEMACLRADSRQIPAMVAQADEQLLAFGQVGKVS